MSHEQIAALALGALLVFWMVGAYNRVVAMRNKIGQAWAQIDEPLKRRKETLPLLVGTLRETWPNEQGALDAVLTAQGQAAGAADAVRAKPVAAPAVAALAAAEGQLASAMARLRALLEQDAALREREDIAGWLRELHEADQRRAFARQLFNDAVAAYNSAAHQWPTRALVWIYGFQDAGTL
jgi:LemA protein